MRALAWRSPPPTPPPDAAAHSLESPFPSARGEPFEVYRIWVRRVAVGVWCYTQAMQEHATGEGGQRRKLLKWPAAIEMITPYVVKISTREGFGTGFLFAMSSNRILCGVATAAHVINTAYRWEEPIDIQHFESGKSVRVRDDGDERAIFVDEEHDTAALVIVKGSLPFPDQLFPLVDKDRYVRVGVEAGWMGFPNLSANNLCFFSGRISCRVDDISAYFVDGVAVHGVSGGPAFRLGVATAILMGVVSSYIPNRATGETLPGLCVIRDVTHLHNVIATFRGVGEARARAEAEAKAKQRAAQPEGEPQLPPTQQEGDQPPGHADELGEGGPTQDPSSSNS